MLFVNTIGLFLIALIVWWFWVYKPKDIAAVSTDALIRVENGIYQPARVLATANEPLTLDFLRVDETACAEKVIFPDLEISEDLPLNKKYSLSLPALAPGEYVFHCQMKMYKGVLVVSD